MSAPGVALLVAAGGGLVAAVGLLTLWWSRAQVRLALVLGGGRHVKVGEVASGRAPDRRRLRVVGRIRCADPLHAPDDERLVAFHRDVEVELPGHRWRTIDRVRETRSFELWDHAGALIVDPAAAAEPLITIPRVWEGSAAELDPEFGPAIARLAVRHGPPAAARALVRTISVTDTLSVVARVEPGADGAPRLVPPPGGYLITNLELDAAMRLLAGPRRRLALLGALATATGVAIGAAAILAAAVLAALGG